MSVKISYVSKYSLILFMNEKINLENKKPLIAFQAQFAQCFSILKNIIFLVFFSEPA